MQTVTEVVSQPGVWVAAAAWAERFRSAVPDGERVAFIGCGTSWYVAQSAAALRELSGCGESDAFAASEFPRGRQYDRVVAISRSASTTEVVRALAELPDEIPTLAVVAASSGPVVDSVHETLVLDFADETSVVQTRFATGVLAMVRTAYGHDLESATAAAYRLLDEDDPLGTVRDDVLACRRFVFLGQGWTVGLAHEAALKLREAALASTESYPAMEYRHGPIALAEPRTAVWIFSPDSAGLADEVRELGAVVVSDSTDPLVSLVAVHLLALAIARRDGLDPDTPRHLTRAVVLEPAGGAR